MAFEESEILKDECKKEDETTIAYWGPSESYVKDQIRDGLKLGYSIKNIETFLIAAGCKDARKRIESYLAKEKR